MDSIGCNLHWVHWALIGYNLTRSLEIGSICTFVFPLRSQDSLTVIIVSIKCFQMQDRLLLKRDKLRRNHGRSHSYRDLSCHRQLEDLRLCCRKCFRLERTYLVNFLQTFQFGFNCSELLFQPLENKTFMPWCLIMLPRAILACCPTILGALWGWNKSR